MSGTRKLSLKQQRFVDAYLETGNATEAARRAGYQATEAALRTIGWENLTKLDIKQRVAARIAEAEVTAAEVRGTLASHLRSDITAVLDDDGAFDVKTIRRKKLGHLVKAVTIRRTLEKQIDGDEVSFVPVETVRLELHSSQTAAVQLCKVLGIEKAPQPSDAEKWERIAAELADKYSVPVETVKRDLASENPELASILIQ